MIEKVMRLAIQWARKGDEDGEMCGRRWKIRAFGVSSQVTFSLPSTRSSVAGAPHFALQSFTTVAEPMAEHGKSIPLQKLHGRPFGAVMAWHDGMAGLFIRLSNPHANHGRSCLTSLLCRQKLGLSYE